MLNQVTFRFIGQHLLTLFIAAYLIAFGQHHQDSKGASLSCTRRECDLWPVFKTIIPFTLFCIMVTCSLFCEADMIIELAKIFSLSLLCKALIQMWITELNFVIKPHFLHLQ
ncbi:Hypothetical_protein [Hexamita inflata]|uniref:Hypothetical_protein n=1 Tax=Hexamita inflata TaxID=28002 RepID=A0AA86QL05_9EUKA|nr:Hypothetical protein HINF_LOCUS41335 [Hexamita inflata]CAI9953695.1 Hypothetical protein HINF_LOCUS41340 [Hexamita inflata]CAI9966002.1 Hypothetical protein HINF_LOCUS53647 [Hexamita inflata]